MIAGNLVSQVLIPARTSDTGQDALNTMNEFNIRHLPIVNNTELLGVVSQDDILNHDAKEPVGSYNLSLIKAYVSDQDHIYDIIKLMIENQLTIVPVVDHEKNYMGMVTEKDLLQFFARSASFTEPGSIIVLEVNRRDYSLAEISRIVEGENAAILSSFVTSNLESVNVDVTLKINKQDLQSIISTFERFDYKVKGTFHEDTFTENLKERYDSFMSYLNV